jgi:hypothetical protein
MSVGQRIADTIDKMQVGDPEGALFQIAAAIEVTAEHESKTSGRSSYKNFIGQHLGLITRIAFGGTKILNLRLAYDHPELKKNVDGCVSVQDIFYHAVRCGLYHKASLPDNLKFTHEKRISIEDGGTLVLPSALIYGLITSVVVSPANRAEYAPKEGMLNLGDFPIPINKLWGRRHELLWLLDAVDEVRRLRVAGSSTASGSSTVTDDPRAKQALYMAQQRKSARVPRKLHWWLIVIGPIVIALVILWALLF